MATFDIYNVDYILLVEWLKYAHWDKDNPELSKFLYSLNFEVTQRFGLGFTSQLIHPFF